MKEDISDNKRIAKNTILLYIRMFFLIIVNLYMSRVVLNALGVEDFGLYSVVGSIVSFLGFLNTAMAAASQRYLSYVSGIGNKEELNSTFNSILIVQMLLGVLILVLAESIGVFYISNYLNVSLEKIPVAHLVYQFSLAAFLVNVITVPYNALIIANERMDVFALFSILDVLIKLAIAFLIAWVAENRLVLYSVFIFLSISIIQLLYFSYCKFNFKECEIRKNFKKDTIKGVLTYSGWNLMGSFSAVAIDQGVNMILNSYFGVIVNAARGIAFQVSSSVSHLAGNFMQAMNPQIVKSYAKGDLERMHILIIQGTRLSYFMLFICALPLVSCMGDVLEVWLGEVPEYTTWFCVLVVINSLIASLAQPLLMGAMATGRIKKYQIVVSSINMLNFPISLAVLEIISDPYVTAYIMIALTFISTLARLVIVRELISLSIKRYINMAFRPIITVTVLSVGFALIVVRNVSSTGSIWELIAKILIIAIVTLMIIAYGGASSSERKIVYTYVYNLLKK